MAIKKVIRFPLEMKDGIKVTNIFQLKEHFDPEKIVKYFSDGTLLKWLKSRYYEDEAEAVAMLKDEDNEKVLQKLCDIFNVENVYEEIDVDEVVENSKRITKLKMYTDDAAIIDNIDFVAFNQEELAELYDEGVEKIYLCEGEFDIPKSKNQLTYIEIGNPVVRGLAISNSVELDKKSSKPVANISGYAFGENKISEDLADVIGRNEYVITDDYVVFATELYHFIPNNSLKTDEGYSEKCGSGIFNIWKIRENVLSTFTIPEYEGYNHFEGVSGNKVFLINWRLKENGVLMYDIDTRKATLKCENWKGKKDSISSNNGNIAYIDKDDNLRLINLETGTKSFIEHIEGKCIILLKDGKLFYTKGAGYHSYNIYIYDINDKSKKLLKKVELNIEHIFFNEGNLFIVGRIGDIFGFGGTIKMVKLDTKNGKVTELFTGDPEVRITKNSKYLTEVRYKDNFSVYTWNMEKGICKKVCDRCGYTERDSHIFRDDDVYYYPYSVYQVGKFLYYVDDHLSDRKYYRINIHTGEKVERFIEG